jgi:UDP-N-acetylglucosamine/UDP-N-acetylgalactosamine diphosphorylase
MKLTYEKATALLAGHGQSHILNFWDGLKSGQKEMLLSQIEGLDFASIQRMRGMLAGAKVASADTEIQPAEVLPLSVAKSDDAVREGEGALRKGEVGVILVAGGQGSRLGYDGPKGCFLLGPVSNASLFAIHSRKILALERKYGTEIPFYIMTSLVNDKPTKDFFASHGYFGLKKESVLFFVQGMWPALDKEGKIILDRPDHVFMSPDGHGGILAALRANGMIDDMSGRGLKTLFYFQVDNPLVEIAEPAFLGLHKKHKADISVKVCAKRDPDEGLGVVAVRNNRNMVVEYTELTKEQKHARLANGQLKFRFGSVAIHVFSLDFLAKESTAQLPLHVAHKKVPYCTGDGSLVKPEKPNAYKFEKFIFDVIPDAVRTLNVEFAREEEFSPVKNAEGSDSPEMARRDMVRKWCRWLETCGVEVPKDTNGDSRYKIDIDPCYATGPDDLKKRIGAGLKITQDLLLAEV